MSGKLHWDFGRMSPLHPSVFPPLFVCLGIEGDMLICLPIKKKVLAQTEGLISIALANIKVDYINLSANLLVMVGNV